MQEGDFRDPFQDAERQSKEREDAAKSTVSAIPSAHSDWSPAQNGVTNSQLLLTNASPNSLIGGVLFTVSGCCNLVLMIIYSRISYIFQRKLARSCPCSVKDFAVH